MRRATSRGNICDFCSTPISIQMIGNYKHKWSEVGVGNYKQESRIVGGINHRNIREISLWFNFSLPTNGIIPYLVNSGVFHLPSHPSLSTAHKKVSTTRAKIPITAWQARVVHAPGVREITIKRSNNVPHQPPEPPHRRIGLLY